MRWRKWRKLWLPLGRLGSHRKGGIFMCDLWLFHTVCLELHRGLIEYVLVFLLWIADIMKHCIRYCSCRVLVKWWPSSP